MIGEALRSLRIIHNLKMRELSRKLGISIAYISELEHGKKQPTLRIIEKYAEFFNMKVSEVLRYSEKLDDEPEDEEPSITRRIALLL